MRATFPRELALGGIKNRTLQLSREKTLPRIALTAIVLVAAALRFANLAALGYANHYYSAAVTAMLQSWHNFFFVAAEPGGSVSVDKPPVGLWMQTISAYFFGVNGFGVLLPEILAGLASVVVIYHLVRRSFGTVAGLIAALALAITPVVVATDRNNTIDSILILTLLLAAWAFIKATETASLRYLLLGAVLVGIGFNVKMLEAFLPLPAFLALYFLGAPERMLRKIPKLALASVVLLVVSFSWITAVDLTPAGQRPYVGSSTDNSEMSLAIGYNGVQRLMGMGGRGGLLSGLFGNNQPGSNRGFARPGGNAARPQGGNGGFQFPNGNGGAPPAGGNGAFPQPGGNGGFFRGGQGPQGGFAGFGGGGSMDTGRAGALRLFTAPLSKEVSWLLPLGLFSMVLLAARSRLRWPISQTHQHLVIWGVWLVAGGAFFSVAGFFHQYYLSTLAPPLAALAGAGVVTLWRLRDRSRWLAMILLLAVGAGTLVFQAKTAGAFITSIWWLPIAVGLLGAGALLAVWEFLQHRRRAGVAAFSCVLAALLLTPGMWAGLTTAYSSDNQSLPAAYSGRVSGPPDSGGLQVNPSLLAFLQANTQGMKYMMAVPSSMQGADYVLASGRGVLYIGGFMGQDNVVSASDLANLVATGQLRYIYWGGGGRGGFGFGGGLGGGQSSISSWVTSSCTPVQGFNTQTRNSGAPDGTGAGQTPTQAGGFGSMQVSLYDCAGGQ